MDRVLEEQDITLDAVVRQHYANIMATTGIYQQFILAIKRSFPPVLTNHLI